MKEAVAWTGASGWRSHFGAYVELCKLRLTAMVLWTALAGAWIAGGGAVQPLLALHVLLGSLLVGSAANAWNMVLERDVDARMRRTQSRPLPARRITTGEAAAFATLLGVCGVAHLALFAGPVSAFVALCTFVSYAAVYTPLKRKTTLNTHVGAISGALPALIGWSAVRGSVGGEGFLLFWIVYLWQLPHFLAIAWLYREDYARGGLRMLPIVDPTGAVTSRQALIGALALVPVSLTPALAGLAGSYYLVGALALGLLFVWKCVGFCRDRNDAAARRVMRASLVYLPLLLVLLMADVGPG